MWILYTLLLFLVLVLNCVVIVRSADCKNTEKGRDYAGKIAVTKGKKTCQRWDSQEPHTHTRTTDSQFPVDGSVRAAENYCRNPSSESGGLWCYTTDGATRWQYCDIPLCGTFVHEVKPHYAGRSGATRLTVHGTGFADPYSGTNEVTLVSNTQSYVCDPHLDGTTTTMITCDTREMPIGDVFVRVKVNGNSVADEALCYNSPSSWRCKVYVHQWRTPYITSISPRSGTPGTVVTSRNIQYTDAYGSNAVSTNGKGITFKRSYMGSQECRLTNDAGEKIRLTLDSSGSDWGYMACKVMGSEIGGLQLSFILSGEYGRSMPYSSTQKANSLGAVEMYQQYAEITSISPNVGSTEGGTRVTVYGNNFDNTAELPVKVMIAGKPCKVESHAKDKIVCTTAPEPSKQEVYPGNRGTTVYTWSKYTTFSQLWKYTNSTIYPPSSASRSDWYDGFYFCDTHGSCPEKNPRGDWWTTRTEGFFVPPWTGEYQFYIKSDDQSKLYFSEQGPKSKQVKIAECDRYRSSYYQSSSQKSDRMNLTAGKSYYMEAIHADASGYGHLTVGVKFFDTKLFANETVDAIQEKQTINLGSDVSPETQVITLNNFATQAGTKEVQKVVVKSSDSANARFRLGLGEMYTINLDLGSTASAVKDQLRYLSVGVGVDSVTKNMVSAGDHIEYTITFKEDSGNLPLMTYKTVGTITVTVSQITAGVSTLNTFVLTHGNGRSDPIPYDTDAATLKSKIATIYQGRCPTHILSPSYAAFKENYEGSSPKKYDGWVGNYYEPFCGSKVLRKPNYIVKDQNINTDSHPYLCFGYKGKFKQYLTLYVYCGRNSWVSIPATLTDDGSWHYTCLDIKTLVQTALSKSSKVYLKRAAMRIADGAGNTFLDQVSVTPKALADTDSTEWRLAPPAQTRSLSVTKVASNPSQFKVEFTPMLCLNNFELYSVQFSTRKSGSISAGSNSLSVAHTSWPSGATVGITRSAAATPAISGNFTLTYKGDTTPALPNDISAEDLKAVLETTTSIGEVSVTRPESSCFNRRWEVTWLSYPGNQPKIEADTSNMVGENVTIKISQADGHVFFSPLMGDFVRTAHAIPQVSAMVRGLPTACSGACNFTWSTNSTPTVTAVSPSSGSSLNSTILTITGSMFDSTPANNTVLIGGVPCVVTAATSSQLTCSVGNGPVGNFTVQVNVAELGLAKHHGGPWMFEYVGFVTGLAPTTGSITGGTLVTLTGTGFDTNAVVSFDGSDCPVVSRTYTEIVCKTTAVSGNKTVDVTIVQAGPNLTSPVQYFFDASLTPTVSSVSTNSSSVLGGDEVTIQGSLLGTSENTTVSLGGVLAKNVTVTNSTHVSAILPPAAPGCYDLIVKTSVGDANIKKNNIQQICYTLRVDNVSPLEGSGAGGTKVTITGQGFNTNQSANLVSFGSSPCQVEAASDTQIVCKTGTGYKTHYVDNLGYQNKYGIGYAWNPSSLEIMVGDSVLWQWDSPFAVTGVNYRVEQTATADSSEYDGSGFRSPRSKTGGLRHQFHNVGTYYYWSNKIESSGTIIMRGKVVVVARTDVSVPLNLTIGGFEAKYEVNSGVSAPVDGSSCPGANTKTSGCSGSKPVGSDANKFNFAYWGCKTPFITDISQTVGLSIDDIVITGTGFSSTKCRNEVKLGDYDCTVSAASTTSLTCRPDTSTNMKHGLALPVTVRVGNTGLATNTGVNKTYALMPHIDSIKPTTGSTWGNTYLTISGTALNGDGDEIVKVAGKVCDVQSVNYTQIICKTKYSGRSESGPVQVLVYQGYSGFWTQCAPSLNCSFEYTEASTPTFTAITPEYFSGPATDMNITGTLFGTDPSLVTVTIKGKLCVVKSVSDTLIQCTIGYVPYDSHTVYVHVSGKGKAYNKDGKVKAKSTAEVGAILPETGSTAGGTRVTITGSGFTSPTTVSLAGSNCAVSAMNLSQIECTTSAGSSSSATVTITSGGKKYPETLRFVYNSTLTPSISSISPTSGEIGGKVTINGAGFGNDTSDIEVHLGAASCSVISVSDSTIECTTGPSHAGNFSVQVYRNNQGYASGSLSFEYVLTVSSLSPTSGSYGGGQNLTISGSGFRSGFTSATICGSPCKVDDAGLTSSQFVCKTPVASQDSGKTKECSVLVTVSGETVNSSTSFTYDASKTPTVKGLSPARGGTMGGTKITITGTGFSNTKSDNDVSIGGSQCIVSSASTTQIVCTTEKRRPSIKTNVIVNVATNGITQIVKESEFYYIDRWSSPFTWGNNPPPSKGELVVIPEGEIILLDNSTEVLKMLIIQGSLIFDEVDLELQAENILVTNGGRLQVGTEENPFQHKAIITLHGHLRSQELPIYGTKSLAVRNGTLDLHGQHVPITWTKLASTATKDSTTIVLEKPVTWKVGDEIVIASTGNRLSQSQNEKKTIASIASDKVTLTLTTALKFEHLGVSETYGDRVLEKRAEVGLLTHNVVVRGSRDLQWADVIEACPNGFNPGEFATQTCFQGRFGEEIGSDQFGAQIVMHSPGFNDGSVQARIEYIEVTYAGQAFRLGRYPIHFHLLGNASTSYVRGCGIHETFNRAVNVHNTHNLMIEHTVIYNIMGGAFFLEDGIETGNTFQYNLAIFVKSSTSLLNDDITPAAYWITNPDNTVQHNHAAGGTHFGFWYRMHAHPDGPSATSSVCQQKIPVRYFGNNTVHSQGWYGLWLFQQYFPMETGACSSNKPTPGIFNSLTTWNCERGAEWVVGGAIQFVDFFMVGNTVAGVEAKLIGNAGAVLYTDRGPLIKDSMIASYNGSCTRSGIVLPFSFGISVSNVTFVNFDKGSCAAIGVTRISGTSGPDNGGFTAQFENIKFVNSPKKARFAWAHETILKDLDGSFSGTAGGTVIPTMGTLPPTKCTKSADFSVGRSGSICDPSVGFTRFAFNGINPSAFLYRKVIVSNAHGNNSVNWQEKRMTHKKGWMMAMVLYETNMMKFDYGGHISNVSFNGKFYGMGESDWFILGQAMSKKPDRVKITSSKQVPEATNLQLSYEKNNHGDWRYDVDQKRLYMLITGKKATTDRRKRALSKPVTRDLTFQFSGFRCFYPDCKPPPDPNTQPPVRERPEVVIYWSEYGKWNGGITPGEGDDVTIKAGDWVIVDVPIPRLRELIIRGTLEFDYEEDLKIGRVRDYTLTATYIAILGGGGGGGVANNGANGRLIVGWEDHPYTGNCVIQLEGEHSTPLYETLHGEYRGPGLGSKFIAAFGGLDLHGIQHSLYVSRLSKTASSGDKTLTLLDAVDWKAGDEIVIASTDYDAWHTEKHVIKSIAEDKKTLTIESGLAHKHIGSATPIEGDYYYAAEVGLLTRNIKIKSESYNVQQSFGARVLVSTMAEKTKGGSLLAYTGYARIRNVEFERTGQEGWREVFDARFSLTFYGTGTNNNIKPQLVAGNSFHDGFSPAVGLFGADGISVSSNIIHHTVGGGIISTSSDSEINDNLVVLDLWPGSYLGRAEPANYFFNAAIDLTKATNLKMTNNIVAGVERLGYRVKGEECGSIGKWTNNVAHSLMSGIALFPGEMLGGCAKFSNFFIYKAFDYGLYMQTGTAKVEVSNMLLVENGVSIFPYKVASGSYHISNTTIIATTDKFDCALDKKDSSDLNVRFSGQARPWGSGRIGISFATFVRGGNGAPRKPWIGIMAYPQEKGVMKVSGVTFKNFLSSCGKDIAVSTSPKSGDAQHPIQIEKTSWDNVKEDNKILYHKPNLGDINPSDCVDMDCDGLKKEMMTDLDGTFLAGTPGGTVLPLSEFEWDGDRRRGLGDYRIPKTMLTEPETGKRLDVSKLYPNKGLYRGNQSQCTWNAVWNAYRCQDLPYRMMIIASQDADTETRRVSPVALAAGGYIDLINGPQDHGWCFGYTCQKRISTFYSLVSLGQNYTLYFTGTSPQKLKFQMLNANPDDAVRVAIYYSSPLRLDVYYQNQYIFPTNSKLNPDGTYSYRTPLWTGQYYPTVDLVPGSNFFETQLLYIIVKGSDPIFIKTKEVVQISLNMPPVTVDDFYGANLISNLAIFLKVPAHKIRIVNVVRETSKRKRRALDTTTIKIEIGDPPAAGGINDTVPDAMSYDTLVNASADIISAVQLGKLDTALNTTILNVDVVEPLPAPSDPMWNELASGETESLQITVQIPASMEMVDQPSNSREGSWFPRQPKFRVLDSKGNSVDVLGSKLRPWQLTAKLKAGSGSDNRAKVVGTTSIPYKNGWFNFTDLAISHSGSGYVLEFEISSPSDAVGKFTATSSAVTIDVAQLKLAVVDVPDNVTVDTNVDFTVEVQDLATSAKYPDIAWKGHTWVSAIAQSQVGIYGDAALVGTTTAVIDPSTSRAVFTNLRLTKGAVYYLSFTAVSTPAEFSLTVESGPIRAYPFNYTAPTIEVNKTVSLRFNAEYSSVAGNEKYFMAMVENHVIKLNPDVIVSNIKFSAGSIIATFTLSGATATVTTALDALATSIKSGLTLNFNGNNYASFAFMQVDGSSYQGLNNPNGIPTTTAKPTTPGGGFPIGGIIGITMGVLVLILVIVIVVVCIRKNKAKRVNASDEDLAKSNEMQRLNHMKYQMGRPITPVLKSKTNDSLSSNSSTGDRNGRNKISASHQDVNNDPRARSARMASVSS